ncbi:hypothetical protein Tco_0623337 [Tanacetum coccineum]
MRGFVCQETVTRYGVPSRREVAGWWCERIVTRCFSWRCAGVGDQGGRKGVHHGGDACYGEERLSLKELIDLCTKLSDRVLDLETTKTAQAKEIASLKKRSRSGKEKSKVKTSRMKKIIQDWLDHAQVFSSEVEGVLDEQEVEVKKVVSTAEVTTESATTTTVDELTLAQTLIEIKAAKSLQS